MTLGPNDNLRPTGDRDFYEREGLAVPQARQRHAYHHVRRGELARLSLSRLPYGAKVLDVGCGDGEITSLLPDHISVTGLDLSLSRLARCGSRLPSVDRVQGDVYALPFAPASFNAALMLQTIEHLRRPGQALREFHRIVAPGGLLCIDFPSRSNVLDALMTRWGRRVDWGYRVDTSHLAFYDAPHITMLLSATGFDVENIYGACCLRYDLPLLTRLTWQPRFWWALRAIDAVTQSIPFTAGMGAMQMVVARKRTQ